MTDNTAIEPLDTTDFSRVVSRRIWKRTLVVDALDRSKLKHHATEVGGVEPFLHSLLSRLGMREKADAQTKRQCVQVEMMTETKIHSGYHLILFAMIEP